MVRLQLNDRNANNSDVQLGVVLCLQWRRAVTGALNGESLEVPWEVLPRVLWKVGAPPLRKGNNFQTYSHLYRSAPPICIAICLSFVL